MTAMHHYLNEHPEIFMSEKELQFFGSDLVFAAPRLQRENYLLAFLSATAEKNAAKALCGISIRSGLPQK